MKNDSWKKYSFMCTVETCWQILLVIWQAAFVPLLSATFVHFKPFCYVYPAKIVALLSCYHQCISATENISNNSPFLLQAKAEGEKEAWEGFRASLRLLHPALVLPLPPDLLSLNPDVSSLPPPPSPPPVEGNVSEEDPGTDSPMMWPS